MIIDAGLILEGGGMRGVFTAGVLDFFIENDIYFKEVIGVSAGACHGASYIAKQHGRAFRVNVNYLDNKNYCSLYSLLKTGDMFGADFVYHQIPKHLDVFDFETFIDNPSKLLACVTNVESGIDEYIEIVDADKQIDYIRASASLPYISRKVKINDKLYLDGGVSCSIPLIKSQLNGNLKNVVILTQPSGYRKDKNKLGWLAKLVYRQYNQFTNQILNRHHKYNQEISEVEKQFANGQTYVIAPKAKLNVGRLEKNEDKLRAAYLEGYKMAKDNYQAMMDYLV